MKNVFDGWTKQCFGVGETNDGRYCALGWLEHVAKDGLYYGHMSVMVIAKLEGADGPSGQHQVDCEVCDKIIIGSAAWAAGSHNPIIYANDRLKWPPDRFRALGVEAPEDWFKPQFVDETAAAKVDATEDLVAV
jgi:hypothetical protein